MARVAVVTGGTRGIGAAISKALKAAGYKVAANYAGNDEAAQKFKAETGINGLQVGRVLVRGLRRRACKQVEADLGPVEVLVNNAGITRDATLHRMKPEQWTAVINTNLGSLFNMCRTGDRGHARAQVRPHHQHLLDQRPEGPDGPGATIPPPRPARLGFTKALAQESAQSGITVNAIAPGYINTEMVQAVPKDVLEKSILPLHSDRPARRAGGDRALRGVPRFRRRRLLDRLDPHRQWRAVSGVTTRPSLDRIIAQRLRAMILAQSPRDAIISEF